MSNETTSEARARLDQAARSPLVRPRDRWVHAVATAALGPVFGLYIVLSQGLESSRPAQYVTAAFFLLVGAVTWWQTRTSTVPRHAKRISGTAMAITVALLVAGVMALNVVDTQRAGGVPVWVAVLVAVVIALPALVGGALIARGPR
jgi:drug/metabolite transporter (DMT)-like permease